MTTTISLEVSYGQLAVFASAPNKPFNDWTDRHVEDAGEIRSQEGTLSDQSFQFSAKHPQTEHVEGQVGHAGMHECIAQELPRHEPRVKQGTQGCCFEVAPPQLLAGT